MKVLEVKAWYDGQKDVEYLRIVCDNRVYYSPIKKVIADLRKVNRDINRLMFVRPDIDIKLLSCLMLKYSEITTFGNHINSIKLGDTANRILARSLKECSR